MARDRELLDKLGIDLPIIQAPMAGANGSAMVIAASEAGGLGSLPCAMLSGDKARAEIGVIRQQTAKPFNVNFFCHTPAAPDPARAAAWKERLAEYYREFGLDPEAEAPSVNRAPFDEAMCDMVEDLKPPVVSFHFGLPEPSLLDRVKATGEVILSSATTVAEARWLADKGCDAVIAQGAEAGGHRGMFLGEDITTQAGTFALVPQVVDAVDVPVIASGGIADGRGIAAAFALGASAAQIGTAYLFTPEATISALHRQALANATDDGTALTNLFSGRPARPQGRETGRPVLFGFRLEWRQGTAGRREGGGLVRHGTEFVHDPVHQAAGRAAGLCHEMGAGELTRRLAEEADRRLGEIVP